jgi:hypothetical protein
MMPPATSRRGLAIAVATAVALPTAIWAQWATNGNDVYNTNSGKVGIGTSSPTHALDVAGYSKLGGMAILSADTGYEWWTGSFSDFESWQVTRRKISDGTWTNGLTLKTNGNVGVGTTTPSTKLHVVGDVTVSGNIAAKYQDVAEWVDADAALPAGTVVMIAAGRRNAVSAADTPYSEGVAGVVSAQPGLVLGEHAPGRVLVAQSGRVRARVDASYGAIREGDLLVSSATAGHAMKSTPFELGGIRLHRPGTLIGKALEPLAEGRGEILVLLTLQ